MSSVWFYDDCCCPTTTTPAPTTTTGDLIPPTRYCNRAPVSYDFVTSSECLIHYELELDKFPPLGLPAQKFYLATFLTGYPNCRGSYYSGGSDIYTGSCAQLAGPDPLPNRDPYSYYSSGEYNSGGGCNSRDYMGVKYYAEYGARMPPLAYLIPEQELELFAASEIYWDYGDVCHNAYYWKRVMCIGSRTFLSNILAQCVEARNRAAANSNTVWKYFVWNAEIADDPIITLDVRPELFFPNAFAHHRLFGCADGCSLPAILLLSLVLTIKHSAISTVYDIRPDRQTSKTCIEPEIMHLISINLIRYTNIQFPWVLNYQNPEANTKVFEFNAVPFGPEYELRRFRVSTGTCMRPVYGYSNCFITDPFYLSGCIPSYCFRSHIADAFYQAIKQYLLSIRAKLIFDSVRSVCTIDPRDYIIYSYVDCSIALGGSSGDLSQLWWLLQ